MPHPKPVWLNGKREERRRLKDIDRFLSPDTIYNMIIEGETWHYLTNVEYYKKRDRALLATVFLIGCRISEVVQLKKSQFDFFDPEFIVIKDFVINKRKKQTIQREGRPKIDFPLPRTGGLSKFTDLILEYYELASEEMFKIGRKRGWAIINHMTGKWCHFYRCQRISHLVNKLHSALITSKIMGIKNPQTISHYYKTEWTEHRDKLKE